MRTLAAVLDEPVDKEALEVGGAANIEEIDVQEPTGEEVLVEMTAASLCHTDLASALGHITERFPYVMGHEGTGVVRKVGDAVTAVGPGDTVVLGRITCGRCEQCQAGRGQHCLRRAAAKQAGSLRTGAVRFGANGRPVHHYHGVSSFTSHTLVTEEVAVPIPDELSPEQATLLGCAVFTGAGAAMNTVDVEPGDAVAVFGAGGVGLSAVQGARIRGATTIVAVDLLPEKLAIAEDVGATRTVDASAVEDPAAYLQDLTDGGVDFAFDTAGTLRTIRQSVASLSTNGTAVLVGIPPSGLRSLDIDLYEVVVGERTIVGSFNGSYTLPRAIPRLAELALAGRLRLDPLISEVRPLEEVNAAIAALHHGSGIRQVLEP